jgi:hypothetical protein
LLGDGVAATHLSKHRAAVDHGGLKPLVGRTLQSAYRWVVHKQLLYEFHLGRLTAGDAASFFGNYRVTRQEPRPGRELTLGRGTRCCHGTGGTSRPTPLVVWATAHAARR